MDRNTRLAAPCLNPGNEVVVSLVTRGVQRILDVACGGDNARLMRATHADVEIAGLTHSEEEIAAASPLMDAIHLVELGRAITEAALEKLGSPFDLLLFSQVLARFIDRLAVMRRFLTQLQPGGHVVIAGLNVLELRSWMKFLRENFVSTEHGILEKTHMRLFTYETAYAEPVAPVEGLRLLVRRPRGSLPLGSLRRIGPRRLCIALDRAALGWRPNLFSGEVAMLARWDGT